MDSTPVECGRSRETAKRSALVGWADVEYGLTPLGETLRVPLKALTEWSVQHLPDVLAAHDAYDNRDEHAG